MLFPDNMGKDVLVEECLVNLNRRERRFDLVSRLAGLSTG